MWVFGYGSLMWRPGFDYVEARPARMAGVHRQPCVYSYVHRGTPDRPGIVLGLDRGGSCLGLAFRIEPQNWENTLDYLRGRVSARVGAQLQDGLDARVFSAELKRARQSGQTQTGLQDLEAVQRLMASPVFLSLFDLPWTPLFLAAIFVFHPWLGWLALS